uniref:BMERB domain-containing protein n=1 Tax=Mola mola TaxID=94237 RepID=A0A3Q3W4W4_MOLML
MECKDGEVRSTEGEDGGSKDCTVEGVTVVPPPVVAERTVEEAVPAGPAPVLAEGTVPQEDTQQPAELLSAPARSAEEGSQSVPAPRQQLGSSSRPVPSPRTRTSPNSSIVACKENPFDRSPALPESKTCQTLLSTRPSSPMHGFPLTKRKVQADHNIATESLQVEMRELDERLETMERRGVELERHLRDCTNEEEEEQMLIEWFSLNHERHLLVRRDMELSYLTMQQKLEERQTDVAFQLQCLHFKQGHKDDRGQEQRLMYELVSIIDQRNQIISILDQDMQRYTAKKEKRKKKTIHGSTFHNMKMKSKLLDQGEEPK